MDKQAISVLRDMSAFITHTQLRKNLSDSEKLTLITQTLQHDIGGLVDEQVCFAPRTRGYFKHTGGMGAKETPNYLYALKHDLDYDAETDTYSESPYDRSPSGC